MKNSKSFEVNVDIPMIYGEREDRRMLKNIFIVSLSFMLLFTAYSSTSSLQSSLNNEVGTYSQAAVYVAIVVSTIFMPTYLIRLLTTKWALCLSMLGYSLYIAAQYYPKVYTLMPAGIIVGICAAPLWISKCNYLTIVANEYALIKGEIPDVIVTRFFGIFFCLFQTASIWGNIISSVVLSHGKKSENRTWDLDTCGVKFCPNYSDDDKNTTTTTDDVETEKVYLLASIYLVCAIIAAIIVGVLVDPLSRYGEKSKGESTSDIGMSVFLATFRHMTNIQQLLMIPLTIWSGLEQGFLGADITMAFITCSWGIEKVGFILISYGVVNALSCVLFGVIGKYTGRIPIFCLGALINLSMIIIMFNWRPNPEKYIMYFVIAGFWGMADAIWQTQINAFYGVLFPLNTAPAFSNYRLWESMGFVFAYLMSSTLCVRMKLYILLAFLIVGMMGYLMVESLLKKDIKKANSLQSTMKTENQNSTAEILKQEHSSS